MVARILSRGFGFVNLNCITLERITKAMSDVSCAKCGEPWDFYGIKHGDMTPLEAKKFLNGDGCPCCYFGTKCPQCRGTGQEKVFSHYTTQKMYLVVHNPYGASKRYEWIDQPIPVYTETTCGRCGGNGKLETNEKTQDNFFASSLDATDDPDNDLGWLKGF
jgi:hypothetical protein